LFQALTVADENGLVGGDQDHHPVRRRQGGSQVGPTAHQREVRLGSEADDDHLGVLVDILSRRADHLSRQLDQALDEVAEIRSMIVGMSASKDISAPLDSAQAAGRLNISRRKLDELVAGGHPVF